MIYIYNYRYTHTHIYIYIYNRHNRHNCLSHAAVPGGSFATCTWRVCISAFSPVPSTWLQSLSEAQNGAEINLMEQAMWRAWEGLKEAVGCSGMWILSLVAWV